MCGLQFDYVCLKCLQQPILLNVVHSPPCSWHPARNLQELTFQLDYLIHLNAKNMNCQCFCNFSLNAKNVQNVEQHHKMDRAPRGDSRINTQQNSQHLEQLHFNN